MIGIDSPFMAPNNGVLPPYGPFPQPQGREPRRMSTGGTVQARARGYMASKKTLRPREGHESGQGDSPSGHIKEETPMGAQQGATCGPGHNLLGHGKVNAYLHRANPAEAMAAGAETFRSSRLSMVTRPMVDGVGGHRWLMLSIVTRPVDGGIDCQPPDG
jgi:hypothetical protein